MKKMFIVMIIFVTLLVPSTIAIAENHPPGAPIIFGPVAGRVGVSYEITFCAVDPDGDQIKYKIDWGDGNTFTTDLYPSGDPVRVSHIWAEKGTYLIKAIAQDEHGLDGPEGTPPLPMTITEKKDRAINTPIQNFIQQFSAIGNFLFLKILRQLQQNIR